jgi:hypothetical protein
VLTGSGNANADLYIFESGTAQELAIGIHAQPPEAMKMRRVWC